jgi:hypothetical protein
LALCCVTAASRAWAGEVHFDPESQAGKEYALPLQQARNEALGTGGGEAGSGQGGGGGSSAGAATPLFGVGVGGGGGNGSGPGSGGEGGAEPGNTSHALGQEQGPGGKETSPQSPLAQAGSAADASYSEGQGLLLLAGILVLGALIGLGLRAFSRQRPAT